MDEAQVKAAILSRVREATGRRRKPIVTAEFSLGSSGVRADIAVFSAESIGLEVKTEKDNLRRLSGQMEAYARYFHNAVAVVAPCHLGNVKAAHLHGASLWTYDQTGVLRVVREGEQNSIGELALNDLMTQAERRKGHFPRAIEARYGATSTQFWQAVAGRQIRAGDLTLLSRFADGRAVARRFAVEREARWSDWLSAQGCL